MAPPINAQHRDATDKGRHIFESGQERRDVIGDLLRRDHQHRNRERERGIDESFQPRHLHTAQPEPMQPRQIVEVYGKRGRYLLMAFVHVPRFYRSIALKLEPILSLRFPFCNFL